MDLAARRFARWVLVVHFVLLAGVLVFVWGAYREVYENTRQKVIYQAGRRQMLLAEQTARGIEAYYSSIINNLSLLDPNGDGESSTTQPARAAQVIPPFMRSAGAAGPLWEQMKDRISQIFVVNTSTMKAVPFGEFGGDTESAQRLVDQASDWIKNVQTISVSKLVDLGNGEKGHLVCVPSTARGGGPGGGGPGGGPGGGGPGGGGRQQDRTRPDRGGGPDGGGRGALDRGPEGPPQPGSDRASEAPVDRPQDRPRTATRPGAAPAFGRTDRACVVAVVPLERIKKQFLDRINQSRGSGAMLLDQTSMVMSAYEPKLIGLHINQDAHDPMVRAMATKFLAVGKAGTDVSENPVTIGPVTLPRAMTSLQPIDLKDKRWWIVLSSDLEDVDAIIAEIFDRARFWALFAVIAITAILVSTAWQLIRSRARLERMRHDMLADQISQAREIQVAWLPKNEDDPDRMDLAAINFPANHISGDFYNWFNLPDGRTVVVIGDVTGHGMAAAFLMATTQLLVRNIMPQLNGDPGACLTEVNRQLCTQIFNGQFVTMLVLVIDPDKCHIEAAVGGHPPPLVSENGTFRQIEIEPQLVLGIEKNVDYPTERILLPRGASLVLYTDGVVDAVSSSGERFTTEKLAEALQGDYPHAQAIVDSVIRIVDDFRAGKDLVDDLTLVAVQLEPSNQTGRCEPELVGAK